MRYLTQTSELQLSREEFTGKWPKKQILEYLIDPRINNLQRFTDIQFERHPYIIRNHKHN